MEPALRRRALRVAGVFALIGAVLNFCMGSPSAFMTARGPTAEREAPKVTMNARTSAQEMVVDEELNFFKQPHHLKVLFRGLDASRAQRTSRESVALHGVVTLRQKTGDWYVHVGHPKKAWVLGGEKQNILAALKDNFDAIESGDDQDWRSRVTFLVPYGPACSFINAIRDALSHIEGAKVILRELATKEGLLCVYHDRREATMAAAAAVLDQLERCPMEMRDMIHTQQNYVDYYKLPTSIKMDLTAEETARVIGRGGGCINFIRQQYFVEADLDDDELTLTGTVGDVQAAHAVIVKNLNVRSSRERRTG